NWSCCKVCLRFFASLRLSGGMRRLKLWPAPLFAQESHQERIPIHTVMEICLAEAALRPEAHLFVTSDSPRVVGIDVKVNAVEVQSVETPADQSLHGIGAEPLRPVLARTDDDPHLARPIAPVDNMVAAHSNVFPGI